MTTVAQQQAQRPCQYCTKPVGYGDHEKYCSENPENLARDCGYIGCEHPGNIISDYEWICRHHADLRNARARLRSAAGKISFAKSSMKQLQAELEKVRLSIPQMMFDETEAREHLEKTKFKNALNGVKTKA